MAHESQAYSRALCVAAIVAAAAAVPGFYWFPHIADDLRSAWPLLGSYLHGEPVNPAAYCEAAADIFRGNHFRLPNLLMPLVILLPKWLPAVLSGAALCAVYVLGAALCGFSRRPLPVVLFIAGMSLMFPWVDQLYLTSFQLPYLWGTTLAMWLILLMLSRKGHVAAVAALALAVGVWHEAIAGPVLAGIVVLRLVSPAHRDRRTAWAAVCLALGIGVVALPLFLRHFPSGHAFFESRPALVYPILLPTAAYAIVWCLMLARGRRPGAAHVFLLTVSLSAAAITLYFNAGPRTDALGSACSLAGLCGFIPASRRRRWFLSAIIFSAVLAHTAAVDAMCLRLRDETRHVLDAYRAGDGATIFAPMTLRENAPWYLFQKPYYDWFAHRRPLNVVARTYAAEGRPIEVVPEALRSFTPDSAGAVPGDAAIMMFRGYMVGPCGTPGWLVADFGRGARGREFHTVPFRTPADTTTYVWIHPDNAWPDFLLHPVPTNISR